jgi:hypothetical protein
MDNLGKASAACAKHGVWWLRATFVTAFLALIVVGLIDAGFASLPFLALMAAGTIEAFLKPARHAQAKAGRAGTHGRPLGTPRG